LEGTVVEVTLMQDGQFIVANEGPLQPPETLARLTARFERAGASADGSGLGLAIVAAIADRIDSPLVLKSPRPGAPSGFEASVKLPIEVLNAPM
jgi:two-component system OmpR family sensor kinase